MNCQNFLLHVLKNRNNEWQFYWISLIMKRRKFVFAAGISALTGAASTSLTKPALSAKPRELSMVTSWPKNFPGLGTSAARLGARISSMSDGKLRVNVYERGSLFQSSDLFRAVSDGVADMYHSIEYYWHRNSGALNFFASVPFGLTATEQSAWVNYGGGQELWDELGKSFGLKPFLAGNTGVQMGGWFNKKVDTVDHLQELRIRMPGLGGKVLEKIGAQPISLPSSKIFDAIRSNKLDATEWFGPWFDREFGLQKVTKYYYYPGFHEPGTSLSSSINLNTWNSLGRDLQDIITTAMAAENDLVLAEFNAKNIKALNLMLENKEVVLRRFSDEIMNAIGNAAGEIVSEVGNSDQMSQKVYRSFINFRRQSIKWSKVSDQAYLNSRLLPFSFGN